MVNILALHDKVKLEFKITHPHQIKEAKIPQGLRLVLRTLVKVHILDDRMSCLDGVLLIPYQNGDLWRNWFVEDEAASHH